MSNDNAAGPWNSRPGDEIESPILWEPSQTFLKYTLAFLLAGAVAFMIVIRIVAPDQTTRYIGPVVVCLLAVTTWLVLARGRTQAAVYILAIGAWLAITGISLFNGGVRTPIAIAYPTSIVLIGWLISTRASLAATCLTVATIIGFDLAESWGFLPDPPPTPAIMHGVVQILVVVLSSVLIVLLVHSYQNRLRDLRRLRDDLAIRAAEVGARKAELQRAQAVANVGSWVYELATNTIRLSAETSRIFGVPEGTTESYSVYRARVYAPDQDDVARTWQAAIDGDGLDHEYRIAVGDVTRWIREKAELEFASDGTPLRALGVVQDITERKRMEHQVHQMAFYDELTLLPNRRLLDDRLAQTMAASKRSGRYGALLFLDLDNLKLLNDKHGHKVGDLLLIEAADRLRGCVREMDTVARFGGDEFVVIISKLDTDKSESTIQARIIAEKICAAVAKPYTLGIQHEGKTETTIEHHCTASIGVVLFLEHRASKDDILKWADSAMHKAKRAGRNTIRFCDSLVTATALREPPASRSA